MPPLVSAPKSLPPLDLKTQIGYGVGEMSSEITGSIMVFFILFFLTSVAGLNAGLAGSVLLVGKIWDAFLDPLIGWLSDQTRSRRWGRRYPWMLLGSIPLGVSFALLWWVWPIATQGGRFIYYLLVSVAFYTAFTAVVVPYATLGAELTATYDERTQLIGYKAAFSIGSSIAALVVAQVIFLLIDNEHQKYQITGIICGIAATLSVYACVWATRQRFHQMQNHRHRESPPPPLPIHKQVQIVLSNRAFLYVMGIYLCSWLGVQITAAMLPYFVVDWMGLSEVHFTQMALTVQGTALLMMFFWRFLGLRWGKRCIYCLGIPLTLIAQIGLFLLQPGQVFLMYAIAALAGAGLATAYIVPWSMLPDVLDLDELQTGQRREGVFYGFVVQFQKLAIAIAIFGIGKVLDWAGFVSGTAADQVVQQPDSALWAIRLLLGPCSGLVLLGGILLAARYPLDRVIHQEILLRLSRSNCGEPSPQLAQLLTSKLQR